MHQCFEWLGIRIIRTRRWLPNPSFVVKRPRLIALDPDRGHVYWTDRTDRAIYRVDIDGSNRITVAEQLDSPTGLAIDPDGEKMYWTSINSGTISRGNLDGSETEALVSRLAGPRDIVLDMAAFAGSEFEMPEPGSVGTIEVFPNPFDAHTTIRFQLNQSRRVRVRIMDVLGRQLALLAHETYARGRHEVEWNRTAQNSDSVPPGVYFVVLDCKSEIRTRPIFVSF